MNILNSAQMLSFKPAEYANSLEISPAQATCKQSASSRLLYLAQLISSIVALPVILSIGLISAAVKSRSGEGKETWEEMCAYLKAHIYVGIPVSALGIFAPLSTTSDFYQKQIDRLEKSLSIPEDSNFDVQTLFFAAKGISDDD